MKPSIDDDIYLVSGKILLVSQSFEYGLKYVLFLMSHAKLIEFDVNESVKIIENRSKKMMGQVYRLLTDNIDFDTQSKELLEKAIKERNLFIHEFLISRAEDLIKPEKKTQILEELNAILDVIFDANMLLQKIIDSLYKLYNFNADEMKASFNTKFKLL
jgi:hypothetical protein